MKTKIKPKSLVRVIKINFNVFAFTNIQTNRK